MSWTHQSCAQAIDHIVCSRELLYKKQTNCQGLQLMISFLRMIQMMVQPAFKIQMLLNNIKQTIA